MKAKHIILDFRFENYPEELEKVGFWEKFGADVLEKGKLTLLDKSFHKFQPQGVSGFWLLSESHFSFHTWPDEGEICLDIFSCGKGENTLKAADEIVFQLGKMGGKVAMRKEVERGFVYAK